MAPASSRQSELQLQAARPSQAANPFLRSWVWKREHKPDRDRFDRPYLHQLLVEGRTCTLTIQQARFSVKGFASTVWDSAIVLSKYLERWPHLVSRKHCIELGAGCGLPGITAACLGAASVLLTDFPDNLPLLEQNSAANGVSSTASVAPLEWGGHHRLPNSPFDVVLATDVMYDASATDAFITTLLRISNCQTKVLLAYGRNRQAEDQFLRELGGRLSMEKVPDEELDEVYQCVDVDVFVLRPQSKGVERTEL